MPPEAAGAPASEGRAWRWSVDGAGIAEVVLDVPGRSVNTLDSEVLAELDALLGALAADFRIAVATFVSAKPKGFLAGADLGEIERIADAEDARRKAVRGQKVFHRLARMPFPTLAVIHGACLGGGLEMALACGHRIASLDAELGLPEVQLGFIPGWGGTQRLPRLVDLRTAIDLICSARRVDGREALRVGLVDRAAPAGELRARALDHARELAGAYRGRASADRKERPRFTARISRLALEGNPAGRRVLFARARKQVLARTGGRYPAPLRALEAIEEGLAGSLEAGLSLEARLASELLVSPVSKNLVHVFKLLEGVKKSPWAEAAAGAAPIERVAVLGAGVMGGGIASLLASAGLWVRLKDLDTARVAGGLAAARRILERRLERRKLDRPGLRRAMSRIAGTTDDSGLGRVELVVEAIVEDREAKKGAFAHLDALAPATACLATNTSALSVAEIAPAVRDQRRVAGLHFFNPVERMPLVEIVRAPETSDETVAALYALALRLDKKPVVVRDGPGFLVNRILARYLDEAAHLYAEGVEVAGVDEAMTSFGMPVGPFALLDDVGLDVAAGVARVMAGAFPARMEPGPVLEVLRARGRTGRKAGRGFYLYEGTKRKGPDPALRSELGHPPAPRALPPAVEIEHRLIYPMVDEASRCLAEGVVESAAQVDLAMIAGTGFPPFRGGLLRYADAVGVGGVYGVLERLAASAGPRLSPSSSLREVAARGGFYAGEDPARPELL